MLARENFDGPHVCHNRRELLQDAQEGAFSPAQPGRIFHPPVLSLPRQPLYPGTRLVPRKATASEGPRKCMPHFVWAVRL
jgi:hypothetical protein